MSFEILKKLDYNTIAFIIISIISGLAYLIKVLITSLINHKRLKEEFMNLINRVILECDFNIRPGVGDSKCNFQLESIKELMNHNKRLSLGEQVPDLLEDIFQSGHLCNSFGGLRSLVKPPGMVKEMCQSLKEVLLKTKENQS